MTLVQDYVTGADPAWLDQCDLFAELKARLAAGVPVDTDAERAALRAWPTIPATKDPLWRARGARRDAIELLLWCADRAAQVTRPLDRRTREEFERQTLPPPFGDRHRAWAFDCIREFLPPALSALACGTWTPAPEVSVGLVSAGSNGIIAALRFELMRPGSGAVFQHPADFALKVYADEIFAESIEHAWSAARLWAAREHADLACDARWRLLLPDSRRQVGGESASAAAARGLWHALTGRIPDRGIILFAEMTETGEIRGVYGLRSKAEAACMAQGFDTIAVATDEVAAAWAGVKIANASNRVRVIALT